MWKLFSGGRGWFIFDIPSEGMGWVTVQEDDEQKYSDEEGHRDMQEKDRRFVRRLLWQAMSKIEGRWKHIDNPDERQTVAAVVPL